jgi:cytidyltransferase-like protein
MYIMTKPVRVYVDGVYDLFHRGHVESLEKAKTIRPDVFLIVGLISCDTATGYKREPIFTDDDRYTLLKACRHVDQVVYNPPLIITKEFIEQYSIDLVVHGFSDLSDLKKQQPFFEQIKDKFELLPYFPYNSTSKYIEKVGKYITPVQKPKIKLGTVNHFHGGQDIHSMETKLCVDMSVTTNGLGPLKTWSFNLTDQIDHYPPIKDSELYKSYTDFVQEPNMPVLFGNGATELIDLVLRNIPAGDWKTNCVDVQYAEYENSCSISGRTKIDNKSALITVIVNPNNPTGDFLDWASMEQYIANEVGNNSYLIVDESMLFWHGPDWKSHSFLGHRDYIATLQNTRNIKTIIVQSWTKIFACTGLRFGSLVVYDQELYSTLVQVQPPWSVNIVARDYIRHAWNSPEYLQDTWTLNPKWRSEIIHQLSQIYPDWSFYGKSFLSYIWIDTHNDVVADRIVKISKDCGFPIRHGKHSYNRPTCIRLGVRDPVLLKEWFQTIKKAEPSLVFDAHIPADIILRTDTVDIGSIHTHENVIVENVLAFEQYLNKSQNFLVPTIIVTDDLVLVDGHHRLELMKRMGYTKIPVTVINYYHECVLTHIEVNKRLEKDVIIQSALNNINLQPKSTRHVLCVNEKFVPISILSKNISIELQA